MRTKSASPSFATLDQALLAIQEGFSSSKLVDAEAEGAKQTEDHMFALAFLSGQIRKNLSDLADRTNELSDGEAKKAAI